MPIAPERLAELQRLGYQYVGDDSIVLEQLIARAHAAAEGRPDCFARSWEERNLTCARCELYGPCAEESTIPQIDLDAHAIHECYLCDGDLSVELFGKVGRVVDYACSTLGCSALASRRPNAD